ncbi:MAG: sugar ABC transporter ATP-binding protein [Gammaproteobacteria bacterium]
MIEPPQTIADVPAIAVENVRKAFGATVALNDASFRVKDAEVHALLGENGAGKSTLVKMLSGLVRPDAGRLVIQGKAVNLSSPRDAHRLGLQTAFQELTLVPDLTVTQNMLLPYQPTGFAGQLKDRQSAELVAAHLAALDLRDVDPQRVMRDLNLNLRQKIEIARAIFRRPKILLLDEPTSSLSGRDIDWLGELIAKLKSEGVTIVFISHRIPEVRAFCDRLTVLRNGKDTGTFTVSEVSDEQVIELIIGRSLTATFPPMPPLQRQVRPVLKGHHLATGERLTDVSFELRPGEVLGVAGLQGMGQQELFLTLFGAMPLVHGQIEVAGKPTILSSPRDAIHAQLGISLVPEERKTEALFLHLDGCRNASIPVIGRFTRYGLIDGKSETRAVTAVFERIQVDRRALYTRTGAFSGGNQQKIAIAKWLLARSRVLLMFDPTRGVDVGTKHELYLLIRDYVDGGGAVLLYSTEIAELVNLSHRVLVMYAGRTVRELDSAAGEISETAIMRAALGELPKDAVAQVAIGGRA